MFCAEVKNTLIMLHFINALCYWIFYALLITQRSTHAKIDRITLIDLAKLGNEQYFVIMGEKLLITNNIIELINGP